MLEIESRDQDGVRVVALLGEAGVAEGRDLAAHMIKLAAARPQRLVFDFSGLSFISSLAMGELVSLAGGLRRFECRLAIAGAAKPVRDALVRVRLDQTYQLFGTLESAVAAMRG